MIRMAGMAIDQVTDATFGAMVLKADRPVLVEFWQPGCAPCTLMEGTVKLIAQELRDRLAVATYQISGAEASWSKFAITHTPTFVLFAGGREVARWSGRQPHSVLKAAIEAALPSPELPQLGLC